MIRRREGRIKKEKIKILKLREYLKFNF